MSQFDNKTPQERFEFQQKWDTYRRSLCQVGSDPVGKIVEIVYKNYLGQTATRRIVPIRIWYGVTEWHPEQSQWFLEALDLDKEANRSFTIKDIQSWK